VSVSKNELTLFVNDSEVGKYTLAEPADQRFFGFFRYADQTKCRVRNVNYHGDWPAKLPAEWQQPELKPEAANSPKADHAISKAE
ncbi:MAG TPA: DUF1583 domain-containing protein, partial [Lacipirellulaceae bacterium]|nr:DUF1583 domain-containing protein [Lacipirellulaceae bacterium]